MESGGLSVIFAWQHP